MIRTRSIRSGLLGTLALVLGGPAFAANLAVTIDNIEEFNGHVRVAVYDVTNWLDKDHRNTVGAQALNLAGHPADEPATLNFEVEPGEYGAVVYQDLNDKFVVGDAGKSITLMFKG